MGVERDMKMENRKNVREPREINVQLYQNDAYIALVKTRDITAGGMFVNASSLLFPKNSYLDVILDSPLNKSSVPNRFPAIIAHRRLNGMGIRLLDSEALKEYIANEELRAVG